MSVLSSNRGNVNGEIELGMELTGASSLHKLGIQGHIEDIAIAADQQGKGLGIKLLAALNDVAEQMKCYKVLTGSTKAVCSF